MSLVPTICHDCWHPAHPVNSCPVCWQHVHPSSTGMIAAHWDSVGRELCPGERLPYDRAIPSERQTGLIA